jgi:hypothetical protein
MIAAAVFPQQRVGEGPRFRPTLGGILKMNRQTTLGATCASHSPARRRIAVWALITIAAASIKLASVVLAAPATINGIILLVGADESQRVVSWYASAQTNQRVRFKIDRSADLSAYAEGFGETRRSALRARRR